ncbi:MAG TPA: hypothetical protein VFO89_14450 [Thermoanaerobaculia bacterium]|nr:hypothetical protein [Thermoanaerobaculia bacterium]
MLNLLDELVGIIDGLNEASTPYALCGGIAMSVHGFTRATEDIDLLVRPEHAPDVEAVVGRLGYVIKATPMNFQSGAVQIRRVSKVDATDGDTLSLDLLLVTPASETAWATRETHPWRGRALFVVSREGLILLKRFRSSDQDLVDIARLETA